MSRSSLRASASASQKTSDRATSSEVRCAWCGAKKAPDRDGWTDSKGRWACSAGCVLVAVKDDLPELKCGKCDDALICERCDGCSCEW